MMKLTLRAAREQDGPILLQMMGDFFSLFQYPFDRIEREKQILEIHQNPAWGQIWLCCADDLTILGYQFIAYTYSFEFKGRVAYLDEYYLHEDARGHGYGERFLELLLQKYQDEKFGSLRLEIESYNQRAYHLYEKTGFKLHGTRHLMTKFL